MAPVMPMVLLVLIVLMVSWAAPAAAQAAGKPLPSPAATPPIAVQDILARADEQLVNLVRQLLAAPLPFERLQRRLDEIAKPVDARQHGASGAVLRELPIMRLESLARHWDFDASRYARWEAGARRAFAPYEDAAMQLAQRRLAWTTTRAAGMLDGLPPVMSTRVDAVLEQIDACEAALGTVLAHQFDLNERASALKARIHTGTADVAAAIDDIDRRLLRVDVPPLWQGLGTLGSSRASFDAVQRGLEIESRFARDYNAAGTGAARGAGVIAAADTGPGAAQPSPPAARRCHRQSHQCPAPSMVGVGAAVDAGGAAVRVRRAAAGAGGRAGAGAGSRVAAAAARYRQLARRLALYRGGAVRAGPLRRGGRGRPGHLSPVFAGA
jgi:hypothetical protein